MYPAIIKPKTPYITQVLGGLRIGTQVVIDGHVPSWWTEQFDLNLVVGHNAKVEHCRQADIAFHFNPRFNGDGVVLNTRISGKWQTETVDNRAPCPKGHDFEVVITVEEHCFRLTVNGQHFCNYPHKIPFREVGLLWVDGQVQINKIEFIQRDDGGHDHCAPAGYPVGQPYPPNVTAAPLYQPATYRP